MLRKVFLGLALSAALLTSLSCGGGGGSRDTSNDVTMNAPPIASMDGFMWELPLSVVQVPNGVLGIAVGDIIDNESRGFLTFDISGLPPPPAVVRAAVLEFEQWTVTNDPYPNYGTVVIDHVNMYGTFDDADFNEPALHAGFSTVTTSPGRQTLTLDVRAQVGADQIAARTESSFRLRFTFPGVINSNLDHDVANFNDTENHAGAGGVLPKLTVIYSP